MGLTFHFCNREFEFQWINEENNIQQDQTAHPFFWWASLLHCNYKLSENLKSAFIPYINALQEVPMKS